MSETSSAPETAAQSGVEPTDGKPEASPSPSSPDQQDWEGIALLRQIFPELSLEELQKLHCNHLQRNSSVRTATPDSSVQQPTSVLGQRIWRQLRWLEDHSDDANDDFLHWRPVELPDDFLRLPESVAVRRYLNDEKGKCYYLMLERLEHSVLEQHAAHLDFIGHAIEDDESFMQQAYTRVLHRSPQGGLGMTLCQHGTKVWIHSLLTQDGARWFVSPPTGEIGGPALDAGIVPGDWVLGINGQALLPLPSGHKTLLRDAVSALQYSQNPIVLHLRRVPVDKSHPLVDKLNGADGNSVIEGIDLQDAAPSLLDLTTLSIETDDDETKDESTPQPRIHSFVKKLAEKGVMKTIAEQVRCTMQLDQFTQRARQWESFSSFRLDAGSYNIVAHFDPKDLPPSLTKDMFAVDNVHIDSGLPFAPSTPSLDPLVDYVPEEYLVDMSGADSDGNIISDENSTDSAFELVESNNLLSGKSVNLEARQQQSNGRGSVEKSKSLSKFLGRRRRQEQFAESNIFIPLISVRKALCVRIVNTFMDERQTAYTIWAYDVESGREWYAPVRYLKDFTALRAAALPLCPSLAQFAFPQATTSWKVFHRKSDEDSPAIRDAKCRQLEHFLRKLTSILYTDKLHPVITEICIHLQSFLGCHVVDHELHLDGQTMLNEAYRKTGFGIDETDSHFSPLQQRVRILLKRAIQRYVHRLFLLAEMQKIKHDFVDAMRAQGPTLAQIEAIEAQGRTKMKERAMDDLEKVRSFLDQTQSLILEGCDDDFTCISNRRDYAALHSIYKDDDYLNAIFAQSVREQVEIEVYVPLRGVVSRLIVNGWRHDDMELHFKMNELRKRSLEQFGIPPGDWSSASRILSNGVGMSTLPCCKLRAIVDCAKEICNIYKSTSEDDLGADDFLPIFIYCVVQAQLERPCALLLLLRTLCDFQNRTNQVGYYLASFEAAITHIQELNLAESSNTK